MTVISGLLGSIAHTSTARLGAPVALYVPDTARQRPGVPTSSSCEPPLVAGRAVQSSPVALRHNAVVTLAPATGGAQGTGGGGAPVKRGGESRVTSACVHGYQDPMRSATQAPTDRREHEARSGEVGGALHVKHRQAVRARPSDEHVGGDVVVRLA